jgi:hypothetical protein
LIKTTASCQESEKKHNIIVIDFHVSGTELKKKWKSIKDYDRRQRLKAKNVASGSAAKITKETKNLKPCHHAIFPWLKLWCLCDTCICANHIP